jgi:hypothetical protein
MMPGCFSIG